MKHKLQPHAPSLFDDIVFSALVPEDHLLRRVDRAVDFSFIHDALDDKYDDSTGRPAYNPEVLVRLIFLQLEYNLSDRGVIVRAQTDMAFRGFLRLNHDDALPDPSSLTRFRGRVGEEGFKQIFRRILGQAKALGIVTNRRVMVDSYTVEADISVPGFRSLLDRIITSALDALVGEQKLSDVVVDLCKEHKGLQEDESYRLGATQRKLLLEQWLSLTERVAEVLEGLGERRSAEQSASLDLLNAALHRSVNYGKRNIKKDDILSDVDPDARWSRKGRGKRTGAGFSEQVSVDVDSGMVTNVEVEPGNTDDSEALQSMVDGHIDNVGEVPEEVVTDSKYQSGDNRQYLQSKGITDYIAAPSPKGSKQGLFCLADFGITFDEDEKPLSVTCPQQKVAQNPKWNESKHAWVFRFQTAQCRNCPLRDKCMKPPKKKGKQKRKRARQVSIDVNYKQMQEARKRQETPEGEAAQIERLDIERRFSYQQRHGGKRTRYRGLEKNKTMGWLWGIYLNVRQLLNIVEDLFDTAEDMTEAKLYKTPARPLPGMQCV